MTSVVKNIAGNFLSISVGQAVNLILNVVTFALIARCLSIEDFGNFTLLIAVVSIISKCIDLGLSPIVLREKSRSNSNDYLLNTAITIRVIILFFFIILANIVFLILKFKSGEIIIWNILFLTVLFSSRIENIRDLLTIPYKVDLRMYIPSMLNFLGGLLFLVLVAIIFYMKKSINSIVFAYVFSEVPGFILLIIFLSKRFKMKFKFSLRNYKWLIKESSPLAGFVVLMAFFQQVDLVLIKLIKDSYAAGIFATPLKLFIPFNLLPVAIATTVFPVIIKREVNRTALIQGVYKMLIFIALIVIIIFNFKSTEIIGLVFGSKYEIADSATSVLFLGIGFLFFNFFSHSIFTIEKKQSLTFFYVLILVTANILFDFILIPHYSFLGASISKLIALIVGFLFILSKIKKVDISLDFFNLKFFIFLAVSFLFGYFLAEWLSFIFYTISIVILITLLAWATEFFKKKELKYFYNNIFNRKI